LLSDVEQFQITALNPNEITQWPESGLDLNRTENKQLLPKGIKINLTVQGVQYEWLFSLLNTDYLSNNTNNIGSS
jgi:general secretion pathway protein J